MRKFPFPDEQKSREELKRDVLYRKIPGGDREKICSMAWRRGEEAAFEIFRKHPGLGILEIAEKEGITIRRGTEENIRGVLQVFGEYYVRSGCIVLYQGSIKKWAQANDLSVSAAEEMVAAHEFYHFLECTRIGETSKIYRVPVVSIGKKVLMTSGVRALSEIGAHGFAHAYFIRHIQGKER